MKQLLLASAAVFAVTAAAPASAAVVGMRTTGPAPSVLTLSSTGLSNGATPVATLTGGTVYNGDQPFADQPVGSVSSFLAAGPTSGSSATLTFLVTSNFLSFLWGSPDTYNTLSINSTTGGVTTTDNFTAAGLGFPVTNGAQNFSQYVRFDGTTAGTRINSVTFSNTPSIDAFESANFSITAPVPEPATWALMLVGFGGIGFAMRRRKSKVATSVRFA